LNTLSSLDNTVTTTTKIPSLPLLGSSLETTKPQAITNVTITLSLGNEEERGAIINKQQTKFGL
jgi:hypothetical protein